jgi:hypothetical protein
MRLWQQVWTRLAQEEWGGGVGGGASMRARVLGDEAYTGEHTRVMRQCPYAEGSTEAEVSSSSSSSSSSTVPIPH